MRPLTILRIDQPCHADWNQMRGAGPTRFCDHCNKHVHDISQLTRDQAHELLARTGDKLPCVLLKADASGQAITLDYQSPSPRPRKWMFWALIVLTCGVSALLGLMKKKPAAAPLPITVMSPLAPTMMGRLAPPPTTITLGEPTAVSPPAPTTRPK
jgi:hypothetical protein